MKRRIEYAAFEPPLGGEREKVSGSTPPSRSTEVSGKGVGVPSRGANYFAISCGDGRLRVGALRFQPLRDTAFQYTEDFLNVGESRSWVVVVSHQAVVIIPIGCDVVDDKAHLLHRRAPVFEISGHFPGGFFERAIEAEGLGVRRADACIGAIPL